MLSAVRSRAGIIKRLVLPPERTAYVFGKLRSSVSLVAMARMDCDGSASAAETKIQREINALARVLTRTKRTDHVRIGDLLFRAKLPSLNAIVTQSAASLAWATSQENHPLHHIVHGLNQPFGGRSKEEALLRLPRKLNPAVYSAIKVWNSSEPLRRAVSATASKRVAREIGFRAPL